jgi:hypothetical protein
LGRITEDKGFVPARSRVGETVYAYEYGLSHTILQLCEKIHKGLKREFRDNADYVMVSGILRYIYGDSSGLLYNTSQLQRAVPGLDMDKDPTEKQATGITRTVRMIEETLRKRFGDEYKRAILLLSLVHTVDTGKGAEAAYIPEEVKKLADRYDITMGADNGEENDRTAGRI